MGKLLPYFKWYPGDAETDENFRAMTDAEIGFYIRCLNHSWINGSLPADEKERCLILKVREKDEKKYWLRIGRCFSVNAKDPRRLVNNRQELERELAEKKSKQATNAVNERELRRNARSSDDTSDDHLRAYESVSDYGYGSVVSSSEGEESEKGKPPQGPGPRQIIGDDSWANFADSAKSNGIDGSETDWTAAAWEWQRLDFEQKMSAFAGLGRDIIGKENCLPANYLKKRMWNRRDRKPTNGRETEAMKYLREQAES